MRILPIKSIKTQAWGDKNMWFGRKNIPFETLNNSTSLTEVTAQFNFC
jgi:hypothetical protein